SPCPPTSPPPHLSTLPLHDALPISSTSSGPVHPSGVRSTIIGQAGRSLSRPASASSAACCLICAIWSSARSRTSANRALDQIARSEEHTSELQSRFDLVCRLLLEKK